MSYLPVIIIGAGRSGTNMLRDLLTQLPGVVTWPCDEINYIWRHGNVTVPTDEFDPDLVTPDVRQYVQAAFHRLADRHVSHVVEKTCANSLRVEFVDRILPNACYIYLVRDGRDVALSASKRWTAPLDLPYVLRKARYVPLADLPYYTVRYLVSRAHRLFSPEKRLAFWGPRYQGMADVHAKHNVLEACALQWQHCVDRSDAAFDRISPSRVRRLKYERFVADPVEHLRGLASFLGIDISNVHTERLVRSVSPKSVGSAKRALSIDQWNTLTSLVETTLARYEYIDPPAKTLRSVA